MTIFCQRLDNPIWMKGNSSFGKDKFKFLFAPTEADTRPNRGKYIPENHKNNIQKQDLTNFNYWGGHFVTFYVPLPPKTVPV